MLFSLIFLTAVSLFGANLSEAALQSSMNATVVKAIITGPASLTRGTQVTYTIVLNPSRVKAMYKWKFTDGIATIEENTGSSNSWSGIIVKGGIIEGTAIVAGTELKAQLSVAVTPRDWKMATPPPAQEVSAPAWDGIVGRGESLYQVDNEIQGNPGYVSAGPNKGFCYVLNSNYWEHWEWFHWWITPGFRTANGAFWVKTKQEEGYTSQKIAEAIQGLIGHETDGTVAGSLGHRKIITAEIQGNPLYDPKAAVELLAVYNNVQQLKQDYSNAVLSTNDAFKEHYESGEGHPAWGNWSDCVWFTIQGNWVYDTMAW